MIGWTRGMGQGLAVLALGVGISCGARSGLESESGYGAVYDGAEPTTPDVKPPVSSRDAGTGPAAHPDAAFQDAGLPRDAGLPKDAGSKDAAPATDASVPRDAAAQDAGRPPPAATDAQVVNPRLPVGCEALADHAFLLTSSGELFSFNPDTLATISLGILNCGASLNSMAVARNGATYVSSMSGDLYQVDVTRRTCSELPFDRRQLVGQDYGMGFVSDANSQGESLFIAEQNTMISSSVRLSTIDLATYRLTPHGDFAPGVPMMEVTGTGDGRLYGFHVARDLMPAGLYALDKKNAHVLAEFPIELLPETQSFHFIFWGGGIYIFQASFRDAHSSVYRLDLFDRTVSLMGTVEPKVVGAGVSTCAPL